MADKFSALFEVEFESLQSVQGKLNKLTNGLKNSGIKLNLDTSDINNIISDLSKISRQQINILPSGEITTIQKFNDELGKTVTLKENLTKGTVGISLTDNAEKIKNETKKLKEYIELEKQKLNLQLESMELDKSEYSNSGELGLLKGSINNLNGSNLNQVKIQANELRAILNELDQNIKNQTQLANQMANGREKAELRIRAEIEKTNKAQTDAINKALENSKKEEQQLKNYIELEKQKLNVRQKSIEINRGSLINDKYSDKIKDSINSLNANTMDEARKKVSELSLELTKLDQNARMNGVQVGQKNIMSFGESIKSTATKLGIFVSTAMVLNQLRSSVGDAINYIRELDSAMVDLRKVTDETDATYSKFLSNMHDVALRLGTQSKDMVEATTNWAKTGENLKNATKLAENTILLTKVGDIKNVETAQEYLVPPLKAFNIEAERSIELIDKYNNISNNMATSTEDVGQGLNVASNSLAVAGNTLEQSIALISTASSTTQASGDKVGNALKTISLRLATFKDENGEVIPKLAGDLGALGVQVTDSSGQIRSTFDIFRDLGKIFKDLDKNTQLQLSEMLGGKQQANIVSSILKNVEELDRAYGLATNSAGSAMAEFEKYQQGIQYSIDQLKEQINGLYTNFLDGGFFKGLVNGASGVVGAINTVTNALGSFPTAITTIVGAMTIFNSKFRESSQFLTNFIPPLNNVYNGLKNWSQGLENTRDGLVSQIAHIKQLAIEYQKAGLSTKTIGVNLAGLTTKLALTNVKLIASKVAVIGLQTALSMGLSFAITSIISALSSFVDKLIVTNEELKKMNEESLASIKSNNEIVSSVENLIKKEEELKNKINSKGNTYEQQKQYRSELLDVQRQIAQILPESASAFDEEGNKISNNTNKILENLEAKKKLSEKEALKIIDNNDSYEARIEAPKKYEKLKKQLEDMRKAYQLNEEYMGKEVNLKWIENIEKSVNKYEEDIKSMSSAIETLKNLGWEKDRIAQEVFKDYDSETAIKWYNELIPVVDRYIAKTNEATQSQEEMSKASSDTTQQSKHVQDLQNEYEQLGYSVEEAKNKIEALNKLSGTDVQSQKVKDATNSYGEAINKVKEYYIMLQKINEEGTLTPDLVVELATKYPELGSNVTDVYKVQEHLNNEIERQVEIQRQAFQVMIGDDKDYYNNKIKNSNEAQSVFNKLASQFVDINSENYKFDLKNFGSLNEAKVEFMNQLSKPLSQFLSNLVGGSAESYEKDLINSKNWASTKAKILEKLDEQISKIENRMVNAFTNSVTSADAMNQEKFAKNAIIQLNKLQSAKANIDTSFNEFYVGFDKSSPTFGKGSFSSSGSGKGSGKSSTEKEIGNLGDLRQRYYEVDNALKDVNNRLKENKTLMENAKDKERIDYLKKEIALLGEKKIALENSRKARQQELQELKYQLELKNFTFDSNGKVTNQQQRVGFLTDWANSFSGDDKKSAQESVKNTVEILKKYTDLLLDDIPSITNEITNLANETASVNKEIAELYKQKLEDISDVEDEITNLIKDNAKKRIEEEKKVLEQALENDRKRIESKKKALKEEQDLYNKQYKEDDYQAELDEERNKLLNIQAEIDKLQFDGSRKGKQRLQELLLEYEKQQKVINDKIRQNQNQATNDRFEQEMELLDKELKNKEDAYDKSIEVLDKKLEEYLNPQNLTKLVGEAMKTGFVDVLGETVNLNDAMKQMFTETSVGIASLNLQYDEWLDKINSIKNAMYDMNGYMTGAGFEKIISLADINKGDSKPFTIDMGGIIINGNVNDDTLSDLDKKFKQQQEEIIRIINKKLGG